MKKSLKITLIVLGVLSSGIALDTIQAKIFDNSPLLRVRENFNDNSTYYIDKGIFVNHYHCNNNEKVTTWKGTKFACSVKESKKEIKEIIDLVARDNLSCAEALEKFYQDENYTYSYNCIKSDKVIVKYNDNTQETVSQALKNANISIKDLDTYNIDYLKEKINKNENSLFNNYLLNKICVDKNSTNNCLTKENGYRFEGSSPNNYVLLNNELWRIIGIFELEQKNLIKLIKANSIGEFKWDGKNINNWENSSLNNYLNSDYLNNLDTSILEKVNWNIGTTNYLLDAENIYSEEKKKETQEKYYVGLMNISDYILANPSTSCTRTTKLMDYYKCSKDNWLYDEIKTHSWTINPCDSLPSNANFLEPAGHIADNKANVEYSIYPVIYLNSTLKYNEGDGTQNNPYIISLN